MTTLDATIGPVVYQEPVNSSFAGMSTIIPGIVGQRIKVLQFFMVFAGPTTITYYSGVTALSGPMIYPTNVAAHVQDFFQLPLNCREGDSFIINNSAGVQIGGTIWFAQG